LSKKQRSLTRDIIANISAIFVATLAAAALVFLLYAVRFRSVDSNTDLEIAAAELAELVHREADGRLVFDLAKAQAGPYAPLLGDVMLFEPETGRLAAGSPNRGLAQISPERMRNWDRAEFSIPRAEGRNLLGYLTTVNSPGGPVRVVFLQDDTRLSTTLAWLTNEFGDEMLPVLLPLFVAIVFVTWISIKRCLRPVRRVTEALEALPPGATVLNFDDSLAPSELAPLLTALRRAFERLNTAFAQQSRFFANAAHELRTPLAVLTARLDSLPDDDVVRALKGDVRRMSRLVDQLLTVARLEQRRLDLGQVVDLVHVASDAISQIAPLAIAEEKEVELDSRASAVTVHGNSFALSDAIRNLLENAVRNSPSGGVVTVRVGPGATVEVLDQGPGMSAEERAVAFEPFWRGKDRSGGAGLGLAIVAETMAAHGGQVEILENHPRGCRVRLSLPPLGGPIAQPLAMPAA